MDWSNSRFRRLLSLVLALAIGAVLGLNSYAAPDVASEGVDPALAQECTGSLTFKDGSVNVNGNTVQTGATIMTGSIVNTSSDGRAVIDFGPVGKLELGSGTTVTITCVGGLVQVRSNCSKTYVEVRSGSVNVTQPEQETLVAGKDKDYDGSIEAAAMPGTDWLVDCQRRKAAVFPIWAGLAIAGGASAIAIVVTQDEPSSPIR